MAGGMVVRLPNGVNYSGGHRAGGDKKRGAWEKSQAPPLQLNQFFVYLRDHLLLDKNVDSLIINYKSIYSNSLLTIFCCRRASS